VSNFSVNILRAADKVTTPTTPAANQGQLYGRTLSANGVSPAFISDNGVETNVIDPAVAFANLPVLLTVGPATLASQSGVQPMFPVSRDVVTLAASTRYLLRMRYHFFLNATHSSDQWLLSFAGSGWTILYTIRSWSSSLATAQAANLYCDVGRDANPQAFTLLSTTNRFYTFDLLGQVISTTGGTFQPLISCSISSPGIHAVSSDSYCELTAVGSDTFVSQGAWG